ncbi:hypothetical protein GGI25_005655 [Coemansia spiralis]|uniref:AAA-ATPase-like domain-containing protein n=2 Tax=Coemansia TaxID=4863 RepID=A0A9W8KVJ3_9FUNG|nr:hypothetical protein EDC05_005708 [Coemansia umbellata]KAJ2671006.1 hypothetical protein GGI25_005655 [Coemansia spiralis]
MSSSNSGKRRTGPVTRAATKRARATQQDSRQGCVGHDGADSSGEDRSTPEYIPSQTSMPQQESNTAIYGWSQETDSSGPIVLIDNRQRGLRATSFTQPMARTQSDSTSASMELSNMISTPPSAPRPTEPSSPSKVSGSKIIIGIDFGNMARETGLIVDKTLVCKAFLTSALTPLCICLPRRFGKTFNLSIIEEFFNVANASDAAPVNGHLDEQACRLSRGKLFEDSLLRTEESEFFDEHFCKYPVIRLDFKNVEGSSLGTFYSSLATTIARAVNTWMEKSEDQQLSRPLKKQRRNLVRHYDSLMGKLSNLSDVDWESQSGMGRITFCLLENFLYKHYESKYIVLVDEYDVPLVKMQGKTWCGRAQETYTRLLGVIFKGNEHLKAGLMVGVHKINIAEMSSGVNNTEYVPLVANTDPEDGSPDPNNLSCYFGYEANEIRMLINQTRASRGGKLGRDDPSTDDTLLKMTEWYNGYRIGRMTGKFNPFASVAFLKALSGNLSLDEAAKPYWGATGNSRIITEITLRNKEIVTRLASRLISEYNNPTSQSVITGTGGIGQQPGRAADAPPVEYIQLRESSLPPSMDSPLSIDQLTTLFLYTGYLTLRNSRALKIPDGELLKAWETLQLTAIFGSDEPTDWQNTRSELCRNLYDGDVRGIQQQFSDVLQLLSNRSRTAYEPTAADYFRTFILGKILFRQPPDGESNMHGNNRQAELVAISEGEGGDGEYDWRLTVPRELTDRSATLSVTFEFKRISPADSQQPNYGVWAAQDALNQIVEKKYASNVNPGHRRVEIGVAIGMRILCIRQRMWRRALLGDRAAVQIRAQQANNNFSTYAQARGRDTESGEQVDVWDRELIAKDNSGWRDEHGWITVRVDDEYRTQ